MPNSYFFKHRLHVLTLLLFFLFIFGCAGGTETGNPGVFKATSGVAQKGPLQLGSLVTAQELDANLSPTGKQYTYQIISNLGIFSPSTNYTSPIIDLNATGYYYDEVANAVSTGQIVLNSISNLSEDKVLNINLLTTLAYQRIKKLVTTQGMSIAAASAQAENEVLAVFNIPNGSRYGNFSSLDISKGRDGDYILAAISSIFVLGNNAGNVSALIANFQFDIADDGVLNDAALKTALTSSAKALDTAAVAANLSAKYAPKVFTAADLNNWIDQIGDGVVGKFRFQMTDAGSLSTFTLPAFAVNQLAGLPITVSSGLLQVNGSIATGEVTFNNGDTVVITPPAGTLPAGVLTIYLKTGSTNVSCITFSRGLTAITVTPENPSIAKGLTKQFVATGAYTDGSTTDISSIVTWSSGTPSVATISATGLASGAAIGSTTITATLGTIAGSTSLSVTAAVLQSISITPANPYTGVGLTEPLSAVAVFSDATTNDITNSATWTSDTTSVATINAATGLVTGVSLGTSQITAGYASITGSATFTVTNNPWSVAGSMITGRSKHSATLLSNGKILVAGGAGFEGVLASAELYDQATNTWSLAGSLSKARLGHTATLLANGKVLVVGGYFYYEDEYLNSAELYDPATNTWSAAGNITIGRWQHTATLLGNGKVLVVGGVGGTDKVNAPINGAEMYDPASNTWSTAASMSEGRIAHTATLLSNGKVLAAGGSNGSILASAELYDPATDTWSAAGNMNVWRYFHTATLLSNGKVLVAGGWDSNGSTLAGAELYDQVTNTWSAAGSMTTGRKYHTATLLNNGKVLLAGGCEVLAGGSTGSVLASTELYDPATDSWSAAGSMNAAHQFHTATLLGNGKVLVVGGSVELSWRW